MTKSKRSINNSLKSHKRKKTDIEEEPFNPLRFLALHLKTLNEEYKSISANVEEKFFDNNL